MDTAAAAGRDYQPRVIDAALQRSLTNAGAVVIEGARATGKTMTALHAAASYTYLDDPNNQRLLDIAPASLLEGAAPRLLDEWQLAPELWNLVRRAVDAAPASGRFILTGSSVPDDDVTRHTGAGRFLRLRQRTMSWGEKHPNGHGEVSLAGLFDGERPLARLDDTADLGDVVAGILRSGFPALTSLDTEGSAERLLAYVDDVARSDIPRLADVRHDPAVITRLLASVARSVASEVSHRTLARDVEAVAPGIRPETVSTYLKLLARLFVVEEQPAWTPRLRSRARLRTSPKLHLVDPALAAAAVGATASRLLRDPETLGILFESSVVHDLAVLATPLGGRVSHYRDSNGKEIDAVVSRPDGTWGAVEVKLSGTQAPRAIADLGDVVDQIDVDAVGEPAFRLVVTGTGPTYTADDGTVTAPLHALAP